MGRIQALREGGLFPQVSPRPERGMNWRDIWWTIRYGDLDALPHSRLFRAVPVVLLLFMESVITWRCWQIAHFELPMDESIRIGLALAILAYIYPLAMLQVLKNFR